MQGKAFLRELEPAYTPNLFAFDLILAGGTTLTGGLSLTYHIDVSASPILALRVTWKRLNQAPLMVFEPYSILRMICRFLSRLVLRFRQLPQFIPQTMINSMLTARQCLSYLVSWKSSLRQKHEIVLVQIS